jgi:hypothetical protein
MFPPSICPAKFPLPQQSSTPPNQQSLFPPSNNNTNSLLLNAIMAQMPICQPPSTFQLSSALFSHSNPQFHPTPFVGHNQQNAMAMSMLLHSIIGNMKRTTQNGSKLMTTLTGIIGEEEGN